MKINDIVHQLNEVKMTTGVFKKFLNTKDADNIMIGFEAEMVFPEYGIEKDSPDLSHDSEIHDIDHLDRWESYNDSSRAFSRIARDIRSGWNNFVESEMERLRDEAESDYREQRKDEWDEDDYVDEIREDMESDGITPDEIIEHISEKSDEFYDYLEKYRDEYDEETEDDVYEYAANASNDQYDENDAWDRFADLEGLSTFHALYEYHGLEWPFLVSGEDFDIEEARRLGNDFAKAFPNIKIEVFNGKVVNKELDTWYIEEDSSIELYGEYDQELAVEIVSPPMPIREGLKMMQDFFAWARSKDAYSNGSTGFHVSVSVPNMEAVDYAKLVLFLGDEYVLKQFDRSGNIYCQSVYKNLVKEMSKLQGDELSGWSAGPQIIKIMFDKLKSGLIQQASYLLTTENPEKYFSVNFLKEKYIEFRSAGNEGYFDSTNIQLAVDTIMRYAYAMHIASSPELFKQEYLKKMSKVLMSGSDDNKIKTMVDAFSSYAIRNDKEALKLYLKKLKSESESEYEISSGTTDALRYNAVAYFQLVSLYKTLSSQLSSIQKKVFVKLINDYRTETRAMSRSSVTDASDSFWASLIELADQDIINNETAIQIFNDTEEKYLQEKNKAMRA